ncbi:MAG: HPP family protein [Acidiferrobacteraceae bacterium]
MRLLDDKFKARKKRYLLQCGLATCVVFAVLFVLDAVTNTTIIASLGASAFIAFALPHARLSRPRFLLGGYLIGTIVGCTCSYLFSLPLLMQLPLASAWLDQVSGAAAVGLTMLLMVITNTEHPPAAGLALGFVLNTWNLWTVVVVLGGIALLVITKRLLKPVLVDLA